jgi:hypothetical protein
MVYSYLDFIHSIVDFRPAKLLVFPAFLSARAIFAMSLLFRKARTMKIVVAERPIFQRNLRVGLSAN